MLTTHPRRARYLPDALKSYRQQTHADRELVIVNDGEPLTSHASDIRVVNLPSRGSRWTIGEKRNVGVREARGERIATWDDPPLGQPWAPQRRISAGAAVGLLAAVVGAKVAYGTLPEESKSLIGSWWG